MLWMFNSGEEDRQGTREAIIKWLMLEMQCAPEIIKVEGLERLSKKHQHREYTRFLPLQMKCLNPEAFRQDLGPCCQSSLSIFLWKGCKLPSTIFKSTLWANY